MGKRLQQNGLFEKVYTFALAVFTSVYVAIFTVCPAFADETEEIISSVKGGLGKVYAILTAIVLPLAVIVIVIAGLKMIGGGDRETYDGKAKIIRVLIALALIYLAPLIISTFAKMFSGYSAKGNIF